MSKFKYIQTEHHQLSRIFEYEFDVEDQDEWENLLEQAETNGEDIADLPTEAPSDPQQWMALIQKVPIEELTEVEEDCWTMRKGGYDITEELYDEDGNEV